jgi:hypothetical protein
MLDVAPERHVHIKGNTIYTTRHPAGTADSLRHDYMVARKTLDLIVERDPRLDVDELLAYAERALGAL